MRTRLPPRLIEATWRTVWFLSERGTLTGAKNSAVQIGCGLAVQVSIQSALSRVSALVQGILKPATSPIAAETARKEACRLLYANKYRIRALLSGNFSDAMIFPRFGSGE
jgi:hypothetical protein